MVNQVAGWLCENKADVLCSYFIVVDVDDLIAV
jgi:hypothetical protein